jgi:hypothetical protein
MADRVVILNDKASLHIESEVGQILCHYKHSVAYFNHVCRVVHNCTLIDDDPQNLRKYIIAAVFHDIGIWTHGTIDYLGPSMEVAKEFLMKHDEGYLWKEISKMIECHHKVSKYSGEYQHTVNTFRKADWIDVSLGLLTFGVNSRSIALIRLQYPNQGFHRFLLSKLAKNFFIHPFRPLPMFRR